MSIRFEESDVRSMGRPATGVRGISLDKEDRVVALAVVDLRARRCWSLAKNGIGKRTKFDEYRTQSRGGKGIITMKTTDKTGRVVGALTVIDKDEIMLLTQQGQMVRTPVKDIREAGPQYPRRQAREFSPPGTSSPPLRESSRKRPRTKPAAEMQARAGLNV